MKMQTKDSFHRISWLAERYCTEGDVLSDEHGEYIYEMVENGGYGYNRVRVNLPKHLQWDYSPADNS